MRNSQTGIAVVLFAASVFLSGCGDAMYEMTTEEQAAVVNYSAQTVAKFNSYQQDGEVFVRTDILEGEELAEDEPALPEEEPTEELMPMDTEMPAEGEEPEVLDSSVPDNGEALDTGATMTQALDLGVIKAEYMGHELCSTYQEEDYYAVDAEYGKQFIVVKYNLINENDQAYHIDILAMTPSFSAVVNGEQKVPAQTTILLNDLSTYQSDIEAKGTNETVLLFQVPEDIEEITSLQLNVTMNGNDYTINL